LSAIGARHRLWREQKFGVVVRRGAACEPENVNKVAARRERTTTHRSRSPRRGGSGFVGDVDSLDVPNAGDI
jgi:hypothetical protein